jgi:hypothetical protein
MQRIARSSGDDDRETLLRTDNVIDFSYRFE